MSISLLYHTQGLRDYNFKSYDYEGKSVRITVEQKPSKLCCTVCGSRNFSTAFVKKREIKGVPIGTKFTVFVVRIRRLRCRDCGYDRQEAIPCAPTPKVQYTKTLACSVIELRSKMSRSSSICTGEQLRISRKTIWVFLHNAPKRFIPDFTWPETRWPSDWLMLS
jgi:transposase